MPKMHKDPIDGSEYPDVSYVDCEEFGDAPEQMIDDGQNEVRVAVYVFSHFATISRESVQVIPDPPQKTPARKGKGKK